MRPAEERWGRGVRATVSGWLLAAGILAGPAAATVPDAAAVLPGTEPLAAGSADELAADMLAGIHRFLDREIAAAGVAREARWREAHGTPAGVAAVRAADRPRLAARLGLRDPRPAAGGLEVVGTVADPGRVARGAGYEVLVVRWPAIDGMHGEGLLLVPDRASPVADVVAIPDADVLPEAWVGLGPGVPAAAQVPRRLAESGCRVLVPALVDRRRQPWNDRAVLTAREYLYRPAFELGRHLVGYEIQKVLAGIDHFAADAPDRPRGVYGWGEGGMLALHAGAVDERIDAVCVGGFFGDRSRVWEEPIDRNVFGLLERFGDAELAALILPRRLVIEHCRGPEIDIPGEGGAPAVLRSPTGVEGEIARVARLVGSDAAATLVTVGRGPASEPGVGIEAFLSAVGGRPAADGGPPVASGRLPDAEARRTRQIVEIDRFTQRLLEGCADTRLRFFPIADQLERAPPERRLDVSSPEAYRDSIAPFREYFATEVIGRFDHELLPPRPRSRLERRGPGWTAYRVVLDVVPDVFATGLLVVPDGIAAGERRPVVVCQHGLEGRPDDLLAGATQEPTYRGLATSLAARGFITFAPQNLYLFGDRFRTLQRQANPLGKTLFSIMVPQHRQIVRWLASLPQVDADRIGFYGLSYGGKSAMRIPALVDGYCLSICSADFNDWIWKNASTSAPYSYVWTGEYEIFEFDLGNTFNYAEMAALIAPRPFMVERGHFDGVAPDERVALEFAKVRYLYDARLGLGDRAEIEWFVGPHAIHGQGTFDFLHRHLRWPAPAGCVIPPVAAAAAAGPPAAGPPSAGRPPWSTRCLVGLEVGPSGAQFGGSDPADTTYASLFRGDEIVRATAAAHGEYLVIWARDGDWAYYDSAVARPCPGLRGRDVVREAVETAAAFDLPVVAYCVVQQGGHFLSDHPEFQAVAADGSRVGRFCLNSGYVSAVEALLTEQLGRGVAGFHVDMLDQGFGPPTTCWCETCRRMFRETYGRDMPAGETWDDDWDRMLEFRYESSARFERRLAAHVREIAPEATIDFNYHGSPPFSWEVGQRPVQHAANGDFITGETGVWGFGALAVGFNAEFYRAAFPGRPFQVAMNRAVRMYHDQTTRPLHDLRWELFTLLAHGAFVTIVDKTGHDGGLDPAAYRRFTAVLGEARGLRDDFGQPPVADVGIYFSSRTRDWLGRSDPERTFRGPLGMHRICAMEHLCYGLILDEHVTLETLRAHPVVCLPDIGILSREEVALFESYVAGGGCLVITGQSGQFDSAGRRLAESPLERLVGGAVVRPLDARDAWVRLPTTDVSIAGRRGTLACADPDPAGRRPGPEPFLVEGPATVYRPTTAAAIGELLAPHRMRDASGREVVTDWPQSAADPVGPALLVNRLGAGTVVTFAVSPGHATAGEHDLPEARDLVARIVRLLHPEPLVSVEAPAGVEAIVTHDPPARTIRVHLVASNPTPRSTPARHRPYVLPGLIEDRPLYRATLHVGRDVVDAAARRAGDLRRDGRRIDLTVDDVHDVVRITY